MDVENRSKELASGFVKQAAINYKALLGEMAGGGAVGALTGGLLGGTINTARGLMDKSDIPAIVAAIRGDTPKIKGVLSRLQGKLFDPKSTVTTTDRLKAMARDFGKGALVGSGIGGVAGAAYGPIPHVTKAINAVMPLDKLKDEEWRVARELADKVGYKGLSFLDGVGNGIYNVGSPVLRAAHIANIPVRAVKGVASDIINNADDFVSKFIE